MLLWIYSLQDFVQKIGTFKNILRKTVIFWGSWFHYRLVGLRMLVSSEVCARISVKSVSLFVRPLAGSRSWKSSLYASKHLHTCREISFQHILRMYYAKYSFHAYLVNFLDLSHNLWWLHSAQISFGDVDAYTQKLLKFHF